MQTTKSISFSTVLRFLLNALVILKNSRQSALLPFCLLSFFLNANTLHVGPGQTFESLQEATDVAAPGDTILVHEGIYNGGIYVAFLQGTPSAWIHILAANGESVIFDGGTNAWQFTDAAYVHISGFIFEHQTGNGLNFDDGGSYNTPAHHVFFENCTFRDMNANGNNDLLKLSGLDSFEIRNCLFINGSPGGSGIDMVGCHDGVIRQCRFEDLGSNSIQAKGGTSNIRIEANFFQNGGLRALNLGGSTGLQFFRPIDAAYEAAELKVYSNIFIGSEAPIAFVGSINCEVINNTIYLPEKWVMRILQETVDETRFPPCGYNTFRNNIIYIDNGVNVEVNIGPNTAPETFTFSNNLWFHSQDPNWSGPVLPASDVNSIVGQDPLFADAFAADFDIEEESPGIGIGYDVLQPETDYEGEEFLDPRSAGAFEGGMPTTGIDDYDREKSSISLYPNPCQNGFWIKSDDSSKSLSLHIYQSDGVKIVSLPFTESTTYIPIPFAPSGALLVKIVCQEKIEHTIIIKTEH